MSSTPLQLCNAMGAPACLNGTTLTVAPSPRLPSEFSVDVHADHRQAMAAATLAVLTHARVNLSAADVVEKSFPGFFGQLARVGVRTDATS